MMDKIYYYAGIIGIAITLSITLYVALSYFL